MIFRLAILFVTLFALNANAWTQSQLMRRAYGVRGAAVSLFGNAVDLDGSSEYLRDSSGISPAFGKTNCTFTAWVKLNGSSSSTAGIISSWLQGPNQASGIVLGPTLYPSMWYTAGTGVTSTNQLTTNNWYFIVGTLDGTRPRIYVNTIQTSGNGYTGGTLGSNSLCIGSLDGVSSRTVKGVIDEVSVWTNRALTASEITELYNDGTGKPTEQLSTGTAGLARLWRLDESGSTSNAYDSASGTTAAGTAIGTGDWVTGKVPLQ